MQRLPKQLVPTAQLTNAAATYYTALAGVIADISAATATNVTAGVVTVTVYLVASGGSAGSTNTVVETKSVPANSSVQLWELVGQKVPAGATIRALASSAASINLTVGGYEVVA
jgi:hypothetical protein